VCRSTLKPAQEPPAPTERETAVGRRAKLTPQACNPGAAPGAATRRNPNTRADCNRAPKPCVGGSSPPGGISVDRALQHDYPRSSAAYRTISPVGIVDRFVRMHRTSADGHPDAPARKAASARRSRVASHSPDELPPHIRAGRYAACQEMLVVRKFLFPSWPMTQSWTPKNPPG
jgi:hypothetical protein